MASKELELQNERLKQKYSEQLDAELEQLKSLHPLSKTKEILDNLQKEIAEAKKVLATHQAEAKAAADEENFNATNSISLSVID